VSLHGLKQRTFHEFNPDVKKNHGKSKNPLAGLDQGVVKSYQTQFTNAVNAGLEGRFRFACLGQFMCLG